VPLARAASTTAYAATVAEIAAYANTGGPFAPLASPPFTGTPTAPTVASTAAAGTTQLATTAFVRNGTTTNDNAPAGQVGEYVSSTVAPPGSAIGSNVAQNVTSIGLTAGDWDVYGAITFGASAATGIGSYAAGIGTVTNGMPAAPQATGQNVALAVATLPNGAVWMLHISPTRMSLASTTAVYLVAQSGFTGGSMTASGYIAARRAR
jgi:hypothetical protein